MKTQPTFCIVLAVILTACSGFNYQQTTPLPLLNSTQTNSLSVPKLSPFPAIKITSDAASPVPKKGTLKIWLPPQFDLGTGTPAGKLLLARLNEFSKRRQVEVEVRTKAISGTGGILDSLTTASAVAPENLPDLVALPRDLLEIASLKGLLHSLDDQTTALDSQDWYEYSKEMACLQGSVFGLPFAGDSLILAYRPEVLPEPPTEWAEVLTSNHPFLFFTSDPRALFTIAMYQANQGAVRDDQGRSSLDFKTLSEVLTFYSDAREAGVMPEFITQYQNDQQVWEDLVDNRADLVVNWTSSYLGDTVEGVAIAPIPTPDGASYTHATGWIWSVAARQGEDYELAVELAEFLTDEQFLVEWSAEAGYLPVRPSSLVGWKDTALQSLLNQIALSAVLYPSSDVLSVIAPPLQQAVIQVLKGQVEPMDAAREATESLVNP